MKRRQGTVYLVGAGPGDPKLLTLRGQELLRRADLIVYDHLVAPRVLTRCSAKAKLIYVGKEANRHTVAQASINTLLIRAAKSGKRVVRLKGGDPFLFGRGGEEALALTKAGLAYEVVPGVTSAIAVPAYAGIPVTHRGFSSSVAIVTGHEDPTKSESVIRWESLATSCDTLVFLMGLNTLPGIVNRLTRHGRSAKTPCAMIEWGTSPRQRTVTGTLKTIMIRTQKAAIHPPAVLVVGKVVALRKHLAWFEAKPLFGKRILVTRASEKAAELSDQLEALGAEVEELPAIELAPVKQNGTFREAVNQMPRTDWVFFTSPEGIHWFSRMLRPLHKDVRWLKDCHIGAIGPKTAAAIEALGLHVDYVPRQFSQEGMVETLPKRVLAGKRALILSALESRDVLEVGLRRRGVQVKKIPIYRTVLPKQATVTVKRLFARPFDFVTVTSASCVDHLYEALDAVGQVGLFRTLVFASIGPVTSQAVRVRGGSVVAEASVSTIEGLVDVMAHKACHR